MATMPRYRCSMYLPILFQLALSSRPEGMSSFGLQCSLQFSTQFFNYQCGNDSVGRVFSICSLVLACCAFPSHFSLS
ncbi:hypothetical protein XELAEV_18031996mg [Xenopus laevis]|uniref:Uncharacterized protein n=1 Tax=Xenopus laevis TaxID=8355 RepID=A0A974CNT7_XENLA|nr:hypothetical protein XELAEV_18031996mg [Xenopus laevis]